MRLIRASSVLIAAGGALLLCAGAALAGPGWGNVDCTADPAACDLGAGTPGDDGGWSDEGAGDSSG